MKYLLAYLGGVFSGVIFVLAILFVFSIGDSEERFKEDLTMLKKPQTTIDTKTLEITDVLDNGSAIARGDDFRTEVLILAKDSSAFFDHQKIKVPDGKCIKKIGTFKQYGKTIPVVDFFNEK